MNINWNGQKIRDLRRKMGWSQSDLTRRLNCTSDELNFWEDDKKELPLNVVNQLTFFEDQLVSHREAVEEQPLAEIMLKNKKLGQITSDDLDN